ncbi:MoaD/ThiS family protein [Vulcanococcus sp.]|uniref:MoaD/ThiS family protein n=1 Tax=Vulcanococcus sp. TaxID=2856995 RepID=UPI003F69CF29
MTAEQRLGNASAADHGLRILLFAQLREQAGWAERWLLIHPLNREPYTPATAWDALQLPGSLNSVRIAINQEFAEAHTPLHPGDELAFLPPISGG